MKQHRGRPVHQYSYSRVAAMKTTTHNLLPIIVSHVSETKSLALISNNSTMPAAKSWDTEILVKNARVGSQISNSIYPFLSVVSNSIWTTLFFYHISGYVNFS